MQLLKDVSYWNRFTPQEKTLLNQVIDGNIIRLGFGLNEDVMAPQHVADSIADGKPYAGYWWIDPLVSWGRQAEMIVNACKRFGVCSFWGDAEQWWARWDTYLQNPSATPRIPPEKLNECYRWVRDALRSHLSIPVGVYSAEWFINSYAPAMKSWVYKTHYWEARYLRYYEPIWWKQKTAMGEFDISYMEELAPQIKFYNNSVMRQFESFIRIKGLGDADHLDWNVMTDANKSYYFGGSEVPPVVVPPPITYTKYLVTTHMNVRVAPNNDAKWVRYQYQGSIVNVRQIINGWAEMDDGFYVSARWLVAI